MTEIKAKHNVVLTDRIRKLRNQHGLTQNQLCSEIKKLGCFIDRTTYSKYESGKRQVNLDVLVVLAKFYNVKVDFLLGLFGDKEM